MSASQPGELMGCRAAVWGHELQDAGLFQPGSWVQQPRVKGNAHSYMGSTKQHYL